MITIAVIADEEDEYEDETDDDETAKKVIWTFYLIYSKVQNEYLIVCVLCIRPFLYRMYEGRIAYKCFRYSLVQ
jgi:hypothetical protein